MQKLVKKSGNFDWENIKFIAFAPVGYSIPDDTPGKAKTATNIYIGQIPIEYRLLFFVDGISVQSKKINLKTKVNNRDQPQYPEAENNLIIELDTGTLQFIELDNILDKKGIEILDNWIKKEKNLLLKIGNEYEQYDRELYHFMYDVIGLVKIISNFSQAERSSFLDDTTIATTLLHNRAHAEIYSELKLQGKKPDLYPIKNGSERKPDLKINNLYSDVKSVLITNKDKLKLLKAFKKKIKEDILEKENEKGQVGTKGTFFIVIWSGIVSSILYATFDKLKNDKVFNGVKIYDEIPLIKENKIIFVLPRPKAFSNYYLEVDKNRTIRILDFVEKKGYNKIKKDNALSYLTLINIREGCPFGLSGSNPTISFKLN